MCVVAIVLKLGSALYHPVPPRYFGWAEKPLIPVTLNLPPHDSQLSDAVNVPLPPSPVATVAEESRFEHILSTWARNVTMIFL